MYGTDIGEASESKSEVIFDWEHKIFHSPMIEVKNVAKKQIARDNYKCFLHKWKEFQPQGYLCTQVPQINVE